MAGTTIEPVSLPLEGVLNPRSSDYGPTGSASYISAAAYSGIILLTHERRLYAFSPVAGATTATSNSVCYVWDSRTTGWVKWNLPIFSSVQTFATSAVSCTSTNDVADMYIGGSNGQVFRLEGFADRPTYSGANSNIAWKLLTRQYGQTYAEGVAYYGINRPHQCNIHYFSPVSTTITWKVTSNRNATGYSKSYTTAVNEDKAIALRQLPVDLRGSWLQLELTGSVQSRLEIHAASLQSTESAVRRS
jgi:hypothetical protein